MLYKLPIGKYGTRHSVLTQVVVPKQRDENGEKFSAPTCRPLPQIQDQNPSLRQCCFAIDYRTLQKEVTGTKISC